MQQLKLIARQFSAFLGVGVVATLADYAVFFTIYHAFGIHAVLASLIGYIIGGSVSYGLTRRFVFASSRSHHAALWRFFSIVAAGFVLTGLSMSILVTHLALPPSPARILTYGIVLAFNFLAHRFFTFRH